MSLLMDALRKAEEAKKKAALKAKSEESAAAPDVKDKQSSASAQTTPASVDSTSGVELSMAEMEDVPSRSQVSNLDMPIVFEGEDESSLPSSAAATAASVSDGEDNQSEDESGSSAQEGAQTEWDEAAEADEGDARAAHREDLPSSLADFENYEDEDEPRSQEHAEIDSAADEEDTSGPTTGRELPSSLADFENYEDEEESPSEADVETDLAADEEATSGSTSGRELPSSLADFENYEDEEESPLDEDVGTDAVRAADDTSSATQGRELPASLAELENYQAAEDSRSPESDEVGADDAASQSEAIVEDTMPANAEEPPLRDISEREVRAKVRQREREDPGRRVAQNVFAAKKSSVLSQRKVQIAVGGGVFLLLALIGTYFYISLNQESTFNIPEGSYVSSGFVDDGNGAELDEGTFVEDSVESDAIVETTELAALDTAIDAASQPSTLEELLSQSEFGEIADAAEPTQSAANLQPTVLDEEVTAPATIVTTVEDVPLESAESEVELEVQITEANPQPTVSTATEVADSSPTTQPSNLISFRRQTNAAGIDPNLESAYAAYQQGSLDEAEGLYRRALASDPRQRDALLGLATIAIQRGNSAEALDLYSRLLARNPRDPIARAGLMELLPSGSPANQEADLKRLLNEYPNVAALAYAHGNFLASNQRWSEAQQAYFRALQLAKTDAAVSGQVNPDYAFNLAVSLEHLNQRGPAEAYYREALQLASNHPAGFDLVAVRTRLASLARSSIDE